MCKPVADAFAPSGSKGQNPIRVAKAEGPRTARIRRVSGWTQVPFGHENSRRVCSIRQQRSKPHQGSQGRRPARSAHPPRQRLDTGALWARKKTSVCSIRQQRSKPHPGSQGRRPARSAHPPRQRLDTGALWARKKTSVCSSFFVPGTGPEAAGRNARKAESCDRREQIEPVPGFDYRPKTRKASEWMLSVCPGRESNPYGHCWPRDFKSRVSTYSTTWAMWRKVTN